MLPRRLLLTTGILLIGCARKPHVAPAQPLSDLRVALTTDAELGKRPAGGDALRRPWIGSIVQVLAEETPDDVVPLGQQRVAGTAMTADAMFARGLDNLRKACPQPIKGDRTVEMAKANVQITRFADNHTAARLLLPELWSNIAADAGGNLFATAPARDLVAWTTSLAPEDQRALRGQARVAFQSRSFPISPAILRWTGNGWTLEDPNPITVP